MVGTPITITGTGFPGSTSYAVYVDTLDHGYVATPARLNGGVGPQTDSKGSFSQDIVIPSAQFGAHSVCADTGYPGSSSAPVKACAQYTVEPEIVLSVPSGPSGSSLTMIGTGFPAFQIVALYFDSPSSLLSTPGPPADAFGGFVAQVRTIGSAGPHQICGDTESNGLQQSISAKACAQFVVRAAVVPTILLNPSSGGVGTNVLVTGAGFPTSVQVYITLDGKTIVSDTCSTNLTDATGSFQLQLAMQLNTSYRTCPQTTISYGTHEICADAMSQACADFFLVGSPTAAASDGGIFGPKGPFRLFAVAAGLAALILLAVGGIFVVRRVAKPRSLPPLD